MASRISIVASVQNSQRGWMLRWRETSDAIGPKEATLRQSHWFADVDEAMAVQFGMRAGASFEAALQDVMKATGCV